MTSKVLSSPSGSGCVSEWLSHVLESPLGGKKIKKISKIKKEEVTPCGGWSGVCQKARRLTPFSFQMRIWKRIQFLGFIQLEFPGTPRKGYKATVIYSQKERGKTATTQAEKTQAPLPAPPPPAVGNPSSYLGWQMPHDGRIKWPWRQAGTRKPWSRPTTHPSSCPIRDLLSDRK